MFPPSGSGWFSWFYFSESFSSVFRFISNMTAQTRKVHVRNELKGRLAAIFPISTNCEGLSLGRPGLCLRSRRPNAVDGMKNARGQREISSNLPANQSAAGASLHRSGMDYADWLDAGIPALYERFDLMRLALSVFNGLKSVIEQITINEDY
jgi:hypothetical protein